MSSLGNQWISKANVSQRRGRAGRVRPGESFHLFTKQKFNSMDQFPIPELLRIPLEKTVLELKSYDENEKALDFLSQMPETASSEAINQAVYDLKSWAILDEDEKLTALGNRIIRFSSHPKLSKALVVASAFRCLDKMLTISAILSADVEFFRHKLDNKAEVGEMKRKFSSTSDHLALVYLYNEWNKLLHSDEVDDFVAKYRIRKENFYLVKKLKKMYIDQMEECGMITETYKEHELCNDDLVKAVLFSGMGNLFYFRPWDIQKGKLKLSKGVILSEAGGKITLSSDSVNNKMMKNASPFLTCFKQQRSIERRTTIVRESSIISPLSFILFSSDLQIKERKENTKLGDMSYSIPMGKRPYYNVILTKSQKTALCHLRNLISETLDYFIKNEGTVPVEDEKYKLMCTLRDDLVHTVSSILTNCEFHVENHK